MTDINLRQAQRGYKRAHDKSARFEAKLATWNYVFGECLPVTATPVERLAAENYPKHRPHRLGPYRILSVVPEIARIIQDGTDNNVSINRVTGTTHPDGTKERNSMCKNNKNKDQFSEQKRTTLAPNGGRRYAVDRIIRHPEAPMKARYVVRWYRYSKKTTQSDRLKTSHSTFGTHFGNRSTNNSPH